MRRVFLMIFLVMVAPVGFAAESELTLTVRNHAFEPKEIRISAGTKVKLRIVNEDATPAEFESKPLHREKVIVGKTSAVVNLGPLKPGRYPFVEEYHEKDAAAQGVIIVE